MPNKYPCPICKSTETDAAYEASEHRFYKCRSCHTAYVWPQPTADELAKFYDRYHLSDDVGGVYDKIETRMRLDFARRIDRIRQATKGNAIRLLDVGCAKGFFVKACVDAGIDAEGCDLSASGVEYAKQKLGVKAMVGDLGTLTDKIEKVDVVSFWATIEHLADPRGMLQSMFEMLKPGGYVFLTTGIGDDWLDRMLPGVCQWYDPPQHLFVFSKPGIHHLMKEVGFQIENFDPCYDRSMQRVLARKIRAFVYAAGMRLVSTIAMAGVNGIQFTRFPVGNEMFIAAKKP